MISPKDVHSLSDFQRNAKKMLKDLKKSKRPALLTVNGKGAVVVQDADAYAATLAELERKYLIEAVRRGIEQMDVGRARPAAEVFDELESELKSARVRARRRSTERGLIEKVREGLADAEAGRVVPLDEAAARWRKRATILDRRARKVKSRTRKN